MREVATNVDALTNSCNCLNRIVRTRFELFIDRTIRKNMRQMIAGDFSDAPKISAEIPTALSVGNRDPDLTGYGRKIGPPRLAGAHVQCNAAADDAGLVEELIDELRFM